MTRSHLVNSAVALAIVLPPVRLLLFVAAGMLLHVLADAPSLTGWAPLWPLNLGRRRWKVRVDDKGEVMVVRDGGPRWCRVGATSEAVLVTALVLPMLVTGVWLTWGSPRAVIA